MQPAAEAEIFRANKLSYRYGGGTLALDCIEFSLHRGEFVAIVGPSGCGKSTLLRIIGQLNQDPVAVDRPLDPLLVKSGRVGMMFQTAVLFPWLSVWDNLLFPLKLARDVVATTSAIEERGRTLLQKVGLADFAEHYVFQLSGGMQQRLCLARSLLLTPQVLLLDEPFGALDAMTRGDLNAELQALWLEERPTLVLITHDIAEAVYLADRVVVMSARPGRIRADIPVRLPRPREESLRFGAEFNALAKTIYDLLH
jgi:NitT/TauT family transport system ATP-binding protein